MSEVSYISLFKESFSLFLKILREYFIVIFSIGAVQSSYKIILSYFLSASKNVIFYLISYDVILKPFFLIILISIISQYFTNKKKHDFKYIYSGVKRCYIRFVLFHAGIGVFLFFIGYKSSILLYMLIFLKLPFVESFIYFEDTSVISAIKNSDAKTQGKFLRYMMLLLFMFLVIRIIGFKFFSHFWIDIGVKNIGIYINEFLFTTAVLLGYSYFVCLYWITSKNKNHPGIS